jgi:hypothetical protein
MGLRNGGVGWGLAEIFPRLFTFQSTERRLCASGGGVDRMFGSRQWGGRPDAARRLEPAARRRGPTAIPFRREVTR